MLNLNATALFITFLLSSYSTLSAANEVIANDLSQLEEPSASSFEQDDDWEEWDEEEDQPWQLTGFVEAGLGAFLQENPHTLSLQELTARIDFGYSHELFEWVASGDLKADGVLESNEWKTRELHVSFSPTSNVDMKIGRQVSTWGTGDYLFLNDLFPKDWQSFFAGRDDEYLKAASDSVRTTAYFDWANIDVVYTPSFTADNYLTGERFWLTQLPNTDEAQHSQDNLFSVNEEDGTQWSLRLSRNVNGVEYALYGYKGYWTIPNGIDARGKFFFPEMNSMGASMRMSIGKGVMNLEASHYNTLNSAEQDMLEPQDQTRFLVGYEQELVKQVTGAVQLYVEHKHDQSDIRKQTGSANEVDANRTVLTTRITHMTALQNVTTNFFMFYSPSDHDGYVKPSIDYRYNDQVQLSVGANYFFGQEETTFFGQHQENSNIWARFKYSY